MCSVSCLVTDGMKIFFRQYNPGVTELKKGQVLYYPCENEAVAVADTVVSAETANCRVTARS